MSRADLTRRDLLMAWLHARRLEAAHPDLRKYWSERFEALSQSFGVHLDVADEEREPEHRLFLDAADKLLALHSPFDAYLVAPPAVVALWEQHGDPIGTGLEAVRTAYRALLLDLVEQLWGLDETSRVSAAALRARGHDPDAAAPDELDYW